jgi:hypothetical protein
MLKAARTRHGRRFEKRTTTMLHWLVGSCRVLGLNAQNWMLVIAGAFVVYFAALALLRHHRTH